MKLKKQVRQLKKNLSQQRIRHRQKLYKQSWKVKDIACKLEKLTEKLKGKETTLADIKGDPQLLSFLQSQIRLSKARPKGRRYTHRDKIFAISLYYQGPKSYRHQYKIFHLPCKRSIERWLQGMNFDTGFGCDIFSILQKRVEKMTEMEKVCVLLVDEVSLKEGLHYNETTDKLDGLEDYGSCGRTNKVANQGLVFMVRGLSTNWKQPLAYFFARDCTPGHCLAQLIKRCIQKLYSIGLVVKVCIGDQGVGNRGAFAKLGVTVDKPYADFDNHRVFFMYDPPHLLKSIRNILHSHNINIDGKIAKWDHIVKYYDLECRRGNVGLRASHKLTEKHIKLPPFSKMAVALAAQVLSRSVATGITTNVSCNEMEAEAAFTADFCFKMDELFDSVNSRLKINKEKCTKPMKSAVNADSGHVEFWKEKIEWLKSWKVDSSQIQCIQGWILSLNALIMLWDDIRLHWGFSYLLVARCNQDCLENLFSVIRQKGGCNENPQCNQFRNSLKAAVVDRFLRPVGRNCRFLSDDDNDEEFITYLLELTNSTTKSVRKECLPLTNDLPSTSAAMCSPTPAPRSLSEENVLVYTCGYLCHKIFKKHDCNKCKAAMVNNDQDLSDPRQLLCYYRAAEVEGKDFGLLQIATAAFIELISKFDYIFKAQFHMLHHSRKLGESIKGQMRVQTLHQQQILQLCPSTLDELLEVFVRMRLHHAVKHFNKTLRSTKRKNRKHLKLSHL